MLVMMLRTVTFRGALALMLVVHDRVERFSCAARRPPAIAETGLLGILIRSRWASWTTKAGASEAWRAWLRIRASGSAAYP